MGPNPTNAIFMLLLNRLSSKNENRSPLLTAMGVNGGPVCNAGSTRKCRTAS